MKLSEWNGDFAGIDYVSFIVIDIDGRMRAVSLPSSYASEAVLSKGIGFDASNFGYAKVHASDMVAVPDMESAFVEQKDDFNILHVFCNVQTMDGQFFAQYPRSVIRAAQHALQASGIGDDAKMLVELEFYVFEDVRYSTTPHHSYYYVESSEGIGEEYSDTPRLGMSQGYHRMAPEDRYQLLRNRAVKTMLAVGLPV
jgi:glutamine synthetase